MQSYRCDTAGEIRELFPGGNLRGGKRSELRSPNCRMAKKMLEGEELEIIDAEQNPELVKQYGIRQAPTLVITDGAQVKKYVNASNIQKYVDEELD